MSNLQRFEIGVYNLQGLESGAKNLQALEIVVSNLQGLEIGVYNLQALEIVVNNEAQELNLKALRECWLALLQLYHLVCCA